MHPFKKQKRTTISRYDKRIACTCFLKTKKANPETLDLPVYSR